MCIACLNFGDGWFASLQESVAPQRNQNVLQLQARGRYTLTSRRMKSCKGLSLHQNNPQNIAG